MGEDENLPPLDRAPPGDHTIGVGTLGNIGIAVPGQHVELAERALIEQVFNALTGQHLAPVMLALHGTLRPRVAGLLLAGMQVCETLANGVLGHGANLGAPRFGGETVRVGTTAKQTSAD